MATATAKRNREAVEMLKVAQKNVKDAATQKAIRDALTGKGTSKTPTPKGRKPTPKAKTHQKAPVASPKANGKFTNPFRPQSSYWALTECLLKLGVGKYHDCSAIIKLAPKVMGSDWKEFAAHKPRNKNGLGDPSERLAQNLDVIRRPDYGKGIHDQSYAVLKNWDGETPQFGLFHK